MLAVEILDVGHGLCVVVRGSDGRTFVYDCGDHSSLEPSRSRSRMLAALSPRERVDCIAVSHLHTDHFSGFLGPVFNLTDDVEVAFPRLPVIGGDTMLAFEVVTRVVALAILDPRLGPLDIDLLRRIRQYRPKLRPLPLSEGDSFDAAGGPFQVLWPPRAISEGGHGFSGIRKVIEAYDDAAESLPELKDTLEAVREAETYRLLLESIDERSRGEQDSGEPGEPGQDWTGAGLEGPPEANLRGELREAGASPESEHLLIEAGRRLRNAANSLSLVMASSRDLLLTGDVTRSAINAAVPRGRFGIVVTPHHGGRRYVARSIENGDLSAELWASSAGDRLTPHVSETYDRLPGLHRRTDIGGPISAVVEGGRLIGIDRGWRPWWASSARFFGAEYRSW